MDGYEKPLETGEKDIEKLFAMLKEQIPVPEEMKDTVLAVFTYVLSL